MRGSPTLVALTLTLIGSCLHRKVVLLEPGYALSRPRSCHRNGRRCGAPDRASLRLIGIRCEQTHDHGRKGHHWSMGIRHVEVVMSWM